MVGKVGMKALRLEEEEGGLIYLLSKSARYVLPGKPGHPDLAPDVRDPGHPGPCPGCQRRLATPVKTLDRPEIRDPGHPGSVRGLVRGGQKVQRTLLSTSDKTPDKPGYPEARTSGVLSGVHRRLSTPSVYLGQGLRTSPDVRDPGCPGSIRGPFRGIQNT